MIEILWHGRGGQGAFTASRLLGAAWCSGEDRFALAFPSFGPERRGAPMRAYTKLSTAPIGDRSAVEQADFAVYLDETLFADDFASELKPSGCALVNTTRTFSDDRIIPIDADGISSSILGRAIPNTALFAALAARIPGLECADVERSIRGYMPSKLQDKNIAIVHAVLERTDGVAEEGAR